MVIAYQLDIQVGRPSMFLALIGSRVLLVALGLEYTYPEVAQQTHVVVVVVAVIVVATAAAAFYFTQLGI